MSDLSNTELSQVAAEIESTVCAVYRQLRRPFDGDTARSGLTVPQVMTLEELAQEDGLSLKELSQRLALSHSTVSGIVDRLEKRGLVHRAVDQRDRRVSRILLSEGVRAYISDTVPAQRLGPLLEALQEASPEAQQTVLAGLRTLKALLAAPSAEPVDPATDAADLSAPL